MPIYHTDDDLATLGELLINDKLLYLKDVKIAYMFRPEAPVSNGRVVAGMCIRVDDRNYTIHKHDFMIEIAQDVWQDATTEFQEALMAHELNHIGLRRDEAGNLDKDDRGRIKSYVKHHDIEEFEWVLQEYGSYHQKLREFLDAFTAHKLRKKKAASQSSQGDPLAPEDLLPVEAEA